MAASAANSGGLPPSSPRWRPPRWFDLVAGVSWRLITVIVAASMVLVIAVALSSIVIPILLGLLFACGLHPLKVRLANMRVPAGLAAAVPVIALVLALLVIAWLTVGTVVEQWSEIEAIISDGQARFEESLSDAGIDPSTGESVTTGIEQIVPAVVSPLLEGIIQVVPTVASVAMSLVLSFIVAFFFLKDGAQMWRWIVVRLGSAGELADDIGNRVWTTLSGFVRGQAAIAAIDATAITIGAAVIGVPQPFAILTLTFLGAFIPFIGAFLSGLVAVLLALGDAGLGAAVAMLVVVVVVQLVEGNVLQPWIQGHAVTLHPLVIALSITAGGAIAGFLGVLLAVPVVASVTVAVSELREAGGIGRVAKRGEPSAPP